MNPYDKANWTYLVDIAKAAGKVGFDEIQFDYVRFPTDGDLTDVKLDRSSPKMEATIAAFLKYAVSELHPLKLRVSADLFGLAATRDLGIGQNPRKLREHRRRDVADDLPAGLRQRRVRHRMPGLQPARHHRGHDGRLEEGGRQRHRRAAAVDPGVRLARPPVRRRTR